MEQRALSLISSVARWARRGAESLTHVHVVLEQIDTLICQLADVGRWAEGVARLRVSPPQVICARGVADHPALRCSGQQRER